MSKNYFESQSLKAFVINRMVKLKKEQLEFFKSIEKEKSLGDWLSIKDVMAELGVSRKTIDRWRVNGLKAYQKSKKSSIRIKRKDLNIFLMRGNHD